MLTKISDTIPDHDTLEVNLGLALLFQCDVTIRNGRGEEGEVSTLSVVS
jgi:hypothetical protein